MDSSAEIAISPSSLSHFVLRTSRLGPMRDWYCNVLGAEVVFETPFAAFVTFDDEHHRVALVEVPGLETPSSKVTGLDHVAFTYKALGNLLSTYKRLRNGGIKPRWCVNHRVTTSFYYEDPDSNRIELTYENYSSVEELKAAMNSGNGRLPTALFDPEELIDSFNRGMPFEQFRDGEFAGPTPLEILQEMGLSRGR